MGSLFFVNPAFCSMLGFGEDELRSKHRFDLSPPEDTEKVRRFFSNCKQARSTATN